MVKAIFIDWCPKDALDGMVQLDPWEELAYRRVLDFIYVTGNNLKDDDRKLGWMTKTGSRWPRIKKALLCDGKIYIQGGLVRNKKCDEKLGQLDQKIAQKRIAGRASASRRKSLNDKETPTTGVATAVQTSVSTATPTESQRTQEPKNLSKEKPPSGAKKKLGLDDLTVKMFDGFAKERAPDVNILFQLERFRDWCHSKGRRFKDYPAGFRNWLCRAQEFHEERKGNGISRQAGVEGRGGNKDERAKAAIARGLAIKIPDSPQ